MSEEIKTNETQEKDCCFCEICKSEEFKKFLIVALGTFVGVFCALSLFAYMHKPPMMPNHYGHHFRPGNPMMESPMVHRHHFNPEAPMMEHHGRHGHHFRHAGGPHGDFKKFEGKKNFESPNPQFNPPKPDDRN